MGIIIAAGALFTAVYDVIYKYNSSNTINLNAATVDYTGQTFFCVTGTEKNGAETTTLSFDAGTYMVIFLGQNGQQNGSGIKGEAAVCIAFYKGSNVTVQIGVGGGLGSYANGGGKTVVSTNFALPNGYNGEYQAIASGGGAYYANPENDEYEKQFKVVDGTFAGWEADDWTATMQKIGIRTNHIQGTPATQTHGGWLDKYISDTTPGEGFIMTPNYTSGNDVWGGKQGLGGGAGYFDGGACVGTQYAGGGSCTPWCYPIGTSDLQNTYGANNPENNIELVGMGEDTGAVRFFKLDPNVFFENDSYTVAYGETVTLPVDDFTNGWLPKSIVQGYHERTANSDCGIRAGWVYSVSEDGKSWHGVGPDGLRSATKQDI